MADSIAPNASFLRKKVAGVPVLYLLGALALVMAVYAWRAKKVPSASTAPANAPATAPGAVVTAGDGSGTNSVLTSPTPSSLVATSPYASLLPTTTAYASLGQSVTTSAATPAITSNQDWLSQGVAYLIAQGNTGGAAQSALQTYLTGGQLSMAQGQMRDAVIKQYGLPPNPPIGAGSAPTKEAASVSTAATEAAKYEGQYVRNANNGAVLYVRNGLLYPVTYVELQQINPPLVNLPASDPIFTLQAG